MPKKQRISRVRVIRPRYALFLRIVLPTILSFYVSFSLVYAQDYLGPRLSGDPNEVVSYENKGLIKPQLFEDTGNTSSIVQSDYPFLNPDSGRSDYFAPAQNAPQPLPIPQTPSGGYSQPDTTLPNTPLQNPATNPANHADSANIQGQGNVINHYMYYDESTGLLTSSPIGPGGASVQNPQIQQLPGGQIGYTGLMQQQIQLNYALQQQQQLQQQYLAAQQAAYGYYNPQQVTPYYQAGYATQQNPYTNPYANQFANPYADPYSAYMMQMQQQQQQMFNEWMRSQPNSGNSGGEKKKGGLFGHFALFKVSSPLLDTCKESLCLLNPFNVPETPHRGVGRPLEKDSWLDYPSYWGVQGGVLGGSELVSDMIDQKSGGIASLTYGKYIDNYWGYEFRFAYASLTCRDTAYGREQYALAQGETDAYYPPLADRSNRIMLGDISIHYYPFGNARWRPYMKLGFGLANQRFRDTFGSQQDITTFSMPLGIGVRFWWNKKIALNMELADNLMFQSRIAETQNNFSLTFGITYAFGRSARHDPTVYWPYVPSSYY